jgi:hypothetical protein
MNRLNTQLPRLNKAPEPILTRHHIYGFFFLLIIFGGLILVIYDWQYGRSQTVNDQQIGSGSGQVCIQMIAKARNIKTGDIKDFPTPCDIPSGWEELKLSSMEGKGFVTGQLSYPSEGIPPMEVCAKNLFTDQETCVQTKVNQSEYKIELPSSKYYIYAKARGITAYYSEFVTCGVNVSCPSHAPIVVEVNPERIANNVDPGDWYNYD